MNEIPIFCALNIKLLLNIGVSFYRLVTCFLTCFLLYVFFFVKRIKNFVKALPNDCHFRTMSEAFVIIVFILKGTELKPLNCHI